MLNEHGVWATCIGQSITCITLPHPQVLVIEAIQDPQCRRCLRVRKLLLGIHQLAAEKKLKTRSLSHRAVRVTFSDVLAVTKKRS